MNILFITQFPITDQKGGIERITDILVRKLPKEFNCFSAFLTDTSFKKTTVQDFINIGKNPNYLELERFVKNHKINIIINQQCPQVVPLISKMKDDIEIKSIYVQHDKTIEPYRPLKKYYRLSFYADIPLRIKLANIIKWVCYPIYRSILDIRKRKEFRNIYQYNDKIVILTDKYIPTILKTIGINQDIQNKIEIIGNCVTFEKVDSLPYYLKKKEVIIVSRMTENRKRILLAIKIWEKLQLQYEDIREWQLNLVGSGEFQSMYKKYINRNNIKNINIIGQVDNTIDYYRHAQIYMMTSYAEGWGLTITEAQQYGVVPIAFDSYEAVFEIIKNDYNGIIIKEDCIDSYIKAMHKLMKSDTQRLKMSSNAMKNLDHISIPKMLTKWVSLLNRL